jgi:GT2 family glycosyltransferase
MSVHFSVVIPTFNRLQSLGEVITALEAQRDAPEFEVVVVDDGSTDGTGEWLRSRHLARPLTVLRQDNRGPAAARNAGVAAATGSRVAFLGDDTVPAPSWLAAHARVHRDDGGDGLAVVGYTRWHHRMRVSPFLDYLNEDGKQFGYGLIEDARELPFDFFYTANLSLPRDLMLAEPFDERFPLAVWEDIECSYRLHRRGLRLVYEPTAVVEHDHPTDLDAFCARQERAGAAAVVFYRMHPELGPYLGVGPQGPPLPPPVSWYRGGRALARLIDRLPVRWTPLWDAILRYHYILGLQRGWSEVPQVQVEGEVAAAPAESGVVPARPPSLLVLLRWLAGRLLQPVRGWTHHMTPLPEAGIAREANHWAATGARPTLHLHSNRGKLPRGWVRVSYEWLGHAGGEPLTLLVDSVAQRTEVYQLPAAPARTSQVVRFPDRVRRLRVRPPQGTRRFELGALEVTELHRLQSLRLFLAPYWKALRRDPRMLVHFLSRAVASTRRHGLGAVWDVAGGHYPSALEDRYAEWVRRYDRLDASDRAAIEEHVESLAVRPVISLILPAKHSSRLEGTLRSVRGQFYPHWELIVAPFGPADGMPLPAAGDDSRIRTVRGDGAPTRVEAVNYALEKACGDYCAILEPGTELAPHALYHVAVEIDGHPQTALLYGDEDQLGLNGRRQSPLFKPDWDADLLLGCDFTGHLTVYPTHLITELGGWREGLDGCESWDLALRASAVVAEDRVRHVPHILCHALAAAGPPNPEGQRRVLVGHVERTGIAARVVDDEHGAPRVERLIGREAPLVSILVPTRNAVHVLRPCVTSLLERTDYPRFEVLIIDNQSDDPATLAYMGSVVADDRVHVVCYDVPFNFSAINNFGAQHAKGELLAFVNNDVEVLTPGWLTAMVAHASRPEVGAVGAELLYPDGRIQHAGVLLGLGSLAGHVFRGLPSAPPGWAMWAAQPRRVSAVTGACLVVRAELFRAAGGLDADNLPVAFNDVDFCLRLRRRGLRTILTPEAKLVHHESATRGLDRRTELVRRLRKEEAVMRARWGTELDYDAAYNPNLTLANPSASVAFPPRAGKPWLRRDRRRLAAKSLVDSRVRRPSRAGDVT